MSSLRDQINTISEYLQNCEDTDPAYLQSDIKQLRHFVMYVHLKIEQTLQIILCNHAYNIEFVRANSERIVENFNKMLPIFDEMEFHSKMKAVNKLHILPDGLESLMWKINTYRVHFSHPVSHSGSIDKYRNEQDQLQVLQDLESALGALNVFIKEKKLYITD